MKSYQQTLNYLFSQLPQYQKTGEKAYKANLNNITEICSIIDNPQQKIKTIHIAGSNGKGSTSHMIASILQEAGYKVGLYTSPHLIDFRERIKINGEKISKKTVIDFVEKFDSKFKSIKPSFFEWTVGLAFHYFYKKNTDINVIETGLGGRLDSTNIINPEISVITNISLEHTAILGDTLEKIAKEKAGIIKHKTPVIIGKTQTLTKPVFEKIAKENDANIYFADTNLIRFLNLDLKGEIQQENANTAYQCIKQLNKKGYNISNEIIDLGVSKVIKNTGLLGRFQQIEQSPLLIFDTAHNPDGIKTLATELKRLQYSQLHVIIGMAKDKNHLEMFSQFPNNSLFYFCSSTNERVLSGKKLSKIAADLKIHGIHFNSVYSGINSAKKLATSKDILIVTGSNFIVADALQNK